MSERWPQPSNEDSFEDICLLFLKELWKNLYLELHGRRGEAQVGVDIFDPMGIQPRKAAQCKRHEDHIVLGGAEVKAEVKKALNFNPPLDLYVILTTGKKSTDTDEKVRLLNEEHAESGLFKVKIYYWNEICSILNTYEFGHAAMTLVPGLHARFKHQETEIASLRQTQSKLIESIASPSSSLSNDVELDLAEAHIKAGDPERARYALDQIKLGPI